MTVTVTIDCGNAAFEGEDGPGEVARILRSLANRVEGMSVLEDELKRIHDINGNRVGELKIEA